jgi:hypothetical protein
MISTGYLRLWSIALPDEHSCVSGGPLPYVCGVVVGVGSGFRPGPSSGGGSGLGPFAELGPFLGTGIGTNLAAQDCGSFAVWCLVVFVEDAVAVFSGEGPEVGFGAGSAGESGGVVGFGLVIGDARFMPSVSDFGCLRVPH